ncbi:MAG TPA: redoxin domain-containing protein, partial [Thermomicrobiales bacterium]|nr:redoxin domain-containing protein [Thermomicrobiales bacterium]
MTTNRAVAPPVRAPEFPADAGPWLNGPALTLGGLRGGVALVEFWTYSCVNCLRTLPTLRAWHARYRDHGLTVIGVHTPEFDFERDPAAVARAARDLGVTYPVVLDNDRAIWRRFANRYWPHRYLIDATGRIRHDRAGEGGEAATERAIRALLAAARPGGALPAPVYADDGAAGAAMGAVCAPGTPEIFAGYYRGASGNPGGFREDAVAD